MRTRWDMCGRLLRDAALVVAGLTMTVASAAPASFTVNSTADATDAVPGDGHCATATGTCTLRAAIQEANALPGSTTIFVPSGIYELSIASSIPEDLCASGDLDIRARAQISILGQGAGADPGVCVIDAAPLVSQGFPERVFHILPQAPGSSVWIEGLTIRGGAALGAGLAGSGGGILDESGALLHLTTLAVVGNESTEKGGGIHSVDGQLFFTGVTISENSVVGSADSVGGGGLSLQGPNTTARIRYCTINANRVDHGSGGGVRSIDVEDSQFLNSTISGNVAGSTGGGLEVEGPYGPWLSFCTVAYNTASPSPNTGGGIHADSALAVYMRGTIVAFNDPSCCSSGSIQSGLFNNDTDGSCGLDPVSDLPATDPQLLPLANNGGSTKTHALAITSPAIDYAYACTDVFGQPVTDDQRFARRVRGCDIGAYEFTGPLDVAPDDATLRRAVVLSDVHPNPANTAATIALRIREPGRLRVEIFDVRGRRVRALLDETVAPGPRALRWDGRDDAGRPMGSGVYVCRVQGLGERLTAAITLVR